MFAYDPAVGDAFRTIGAAVVQAAGLANGPSSPRLRNAYRAEQQAALERQLEHLTVLDHPGTSSIDNGTEESHPSSDDHSSHTEGVGGLVKQQRQGRPLRGQRDARCWLIEPEPDPATLENSLAE